MKKFTGILLVSDFDGTFFTRVTESYNKNINEIERFKNNGGLFAFATGRDYYSLLELEPNAGKIANAPVIIANGARLYDMSKKEYILNYPMNMKLFVEFLGIIYKKYPDIGVRFSCENGLTAPAINEIIKNDLGGFFLQNVSMREISLKKLLESGENVYKCVIVHEPYIVDDVRKTGENFWKDINCEFFFTKSYPRGLEVVNSNASKGKMTVKLKEYLKNRDNFDYKLFAIGDYDNDIDMLEFADYGAAPANALEPVKKSAKIHTVNHNEGAVADLIRIIEKDYV